jgi:hypothetical protein
MKPSYKLSNFYKLRKVLFFYMTGMSYFRCLFNQLTLLNT